MRANKSGMIAADRPVFDPIFDSSQPQFLRASATGGTDTVLPLPARLVIITGLSLGLWLIVGLVITRAF